MKWTRRKFLEAGLKGSMVVGSGKVAALTPSAVRAEAQKQGEAAQGIESSERELLRAAIDEIIPASDGMPAASEVGGVDYIEGLARRMPDFRQELEQALAALEEISRRRLNEGFVSLPRADRVKALREMEKRLTKLFNVLRDAVYEAYYTHPQVWKRIGYEFYATNQAGPHMKPFDESMLAEMRKRPRLYREAP